MTILEACYSAGAVIFFVFRKVYFSKLASLQTIYFSYSMMVAFFLWTQIFLWPWEKFSELSKQIYVVDDEKVNEDKGDNVEEDKLFVKDQEAEWSFHTYLKASEKYLYLRLSLSGGTGFRVNLSGNFFYVDFSSTTDDNHPRKFRSSFTLFRYFRNSFTHPRNCCCSVWFVRSSFWSRNEY
eukprot:TRINITY_DN2118_c0_g1_i1.p2 TRINITY_DN2118_c0_g1~~TRINITY_DN2118_c0_g1_i1.p2  ORF type:complete len:181 (+),score=33.60 TRINITY_DN2118_c0_g1_i1:647-1189(+)